MARRRRDSTLLSLPGHSLAPGATALPRERRLTPAGLLLFTLWVVTLSDVHYLLAAYGPNAVLKIVVILFPALAVALALEVPAVPALARRWQWFPPLLCLILVGAVTMPTALNGGYAREFLQRLLLMWLLVTGSVALVDSVRRAEMLLLLYGLSYLWWGLWGARAGLVGWHHSFNNPDGYGAAMVGGVGYCIFMAMSAQKGRFRRAMYVAAGLAVVAVVSSFARGAFLGAVAIYGLVWYRSPNKGRMFIAGVLGAVLVIATANLIHPGQFWSEMQSVFTEGTSEGTGEDRWELWTAGFKVWQQRPLLGVGMRNFGPFASQFFEPGDLGGMYVWNPGILYNRSLHNVYVQFLCETGVVGLGAFFWIVAHFWRRNARLRTAEAEERWRALGGTLRLKTVAMALEASMAGFLVTATLYPMLNVHWFFTTVALNLIVHARVFGDKPQRAPLRTRAAPAGAVPHLSAPPPGVARRFPG